MSRVPKLVPGTMTEAQERVYATIAAGPRGGVTGPLLVWLQSPTLAERAQALGEFCRYNSSLPPRLSELAILVTAAHWQADYEWHSHARHALNGGLSSEVIEAIRVNSAPPFADAAERAVYDFSVELCVSRGVSEGTWQAAQAALGPQGITDLIGILGYYALISMTIKAYHIPLPDDVKPYFQDVVR